MRFSSPVDHNPAHAVSVHDNWVIGFVFVGRAVG